MSFLGYWHLAKHVTILSLAFSTWGIFLFLKYFWNNAQKLWAQGNTFLKVWNIEYSCLAYFLTPVPFSSLSLAFPYSCRFPFWFFLSFHPLVLRGESTAFIKRLVRERERKNCSYSYEKNMQFIMNDSIIARICDLLQRTG